MEYKKLLSVIEKKFSIDKTEQAHLYISLDYQHIKWAVVIQNQLQILEHLYYYQPIEMEDWANKLDELKKNTEILNAKNWKSVNILSSLQAFTLVPKEFFEAQQASQYLKNVDNQALKNPIIANTQQTFEAINIFNIPKSIHEWSKKNYENPNFMHISEVFLNQITNKNIEKEAKMHIFVNDKYLLIVVLNENQVQFCNTFQYKTSRDFLYFVLFVIDELRLDKTNTELKLYGQINQVAEIYRLLNNYVAQLGLWEGNINIEMGEIFQHITKLHYADIWAMMKKIKKI